IEKDGMVELVAGGFVTSADLRTTLTFLGDNLRDHALAAVTNTLEGQPLYLERAVFARGLTEADCEAAQALVRGRWTALHQAVVVARPSPARRVVLPAAAARADRPAAAAGPAAPPRADRRAGPPHRPRTAAAAPAQAQAQAAAAMAARPAQAAPARVPAPARA